MTKTKDYQSLDNLSSVHNDSNPKSQNIERKIKMKPEGIFKNGDLWYGGYMTDGADKIYFATLPTSNLDDGPDYETVEEPERFSVTSTFIDYFHTDFNTQYALQKNIGDKRFGSECNHNRAKRGYCPDCLRKVM